MNSEQKNLAYWFGLTLWPLDAACRYVCGADPNNPDQSPLSLPDPATRPEWANFFHHATADVEVEIFEGKGGARGVKPGPFIAWARSKGCGLDAKFDVLLANSKRAVPVTSPSGDDVEEQAPVADDPNETLAALFDPLPVEALAKMFVIDLAQWKKWQDKAATNGLKDAAKESRGMFNPYKAGVWLVRKGAEGWDDARLYRVLANNLPARSLDDKHLLTGGID